MARQPGAIPSRINEDAPASVHRRAFANDGVDLIQANPLTVSMVNNLSNACNATIVSGGVEYAPGAGYCSNGSFDYWLAGGGSATVKMSPIKRSNDAPEHDGWQYVVAEDDSITRCLKRKLYSPTTATGGRQA
ncbi:MAG: hypothetical protein H7A20_01975 [Rhodanobacteraceae bacterium]|nr:hypothetical protein [Rhodanobacteraceae bacterium]